MPSGVEGRRTRRADVEPAAQHRERLVERGEDQVVHWGGGLGEPGHRPAAARHRAQLAPGDQAGELAVEVADRERGDPGRGRGQAQLAVAFEERLDALPAAGGPGRLAGRQDVPDPEPGQCGRGHRLPGLSPGRRDHQDAEQRGPDAGQVVQHDRGDPGGGQDRASDLAEPRGDEDRAGGIARARPRQRSDDPPAVQAGGGNQVGHREQAVDPDRGGGDRGRQQGADPRRATQPSQDPQADAGQQQADQGPGHGYLPLGPRAGQFGPAVADAAEETDGGLGAAPVPADDDRVPELMGDHAGQQDDDHGRGRGEVAEHRLVRRHGGQDQRAGPGGEHAEQVAAAGHPDLEASHPLATRAGWIGRWLNRRIGGRANHGHCALLGGRPPHWPTVTTIHCRGSASQPPDPANIGVQDCRFPARTYPEGQPGEPVR